MISLCFYLILSMKNTFIRFNLSNFIFSIDSVSIMIFFTCRASCCLRILKVIQFIFCIVCNYYLLILKKNFLAHRMLALFLIFHQQSLCSFINAYNLFIYLPILLIFDIFNISSFLFLSYSCFIYTLLFG